MLRSFRVANHRSIRNERELLLLPAYDKQRPTVPVAAVFGANASGKSNLVDALRFMRTAVRASYGTWEPGARIPRKPYMIDPLAGAEPSIFAVELLLAGVRYNYGFAVDDEKIVEEWLYSYPHGRRRVLFERESDHVKLGSTLPDHRSREDILSGLTRRNALFLSTAAYANQAEFQPVYEWFRAGLAIINAGEGSDLISLAGRLAPDAPDRDLLIELIRCADLGISDVMVSDSGKQRASLRLAEAEAAYADAADLVVRLEGERLNEQTPSRQFELILDRSRFLAGIAAYNAEVARQAYTEERAPELIFLHTSHRSPLSLDDQSAGTRAWLALVGDVLFALEKGSLLVVDEIDASLHPRLTVRLVELFRDDRTNPRGAQLLFTTHDATLLGTSFGRAVLARDQIWFVEKDADGVTSLFPLTDFHPRKDENTERRYLGGSYGAVPAVFSDSLVDVYIAARPELLDDSA